MKLKVTFFTIFFMSVSVFAGSETNNAGDFIRSVVLHRYGPAVLNIINQQASLQQLLARENTSITALGETLRANKWKVVSDEESLKDTVGSRIDAWVEGGIIHLRDSSWRERINADLSGSSLEQKRLNLLLTAHEMLRLVGVDDNDYRVSGQLFAETVTPPSNATVLKEVAMDAGKEGLADLQTAERWCREWMRFYVESYFIVTCEFNKRAWTESHDAVGVANETVVLGYSTYGQSSQFYGNASATLQTSRVYANAQASGSSSYTSFSSVPVLGNRQHQYQYTYTSDHQVYGARIVGIGELQTLPEKVLFQSDTEDSLIDTDYGTREDALELCNLSLAAAKLDTNSTARYFRAKCRSQATKNGRYSFSIVTQNPFVMNFDKRGHSL